MPPGTEARAAEWRKKAARREEELHSRLRLFNSPDHAVVYADPEKTRFHRPDDGTVQASPVEYGLAVKRQCRYATPACSLYPASAPGDSVAVQHETVRRRSALYFASERHLRRNARAACVVRLIRRTRDGIRAAAFALPLRILLIRVLAQCTPTAQDERLPYIRASTASSTNALARYFAGFGVRRPPHKYRPDLDTRTDT
jgi:hypothetical protein